MLTQHAIVMLKILALCQNAFGSEESILFAWGIWLKGRLMHLAQWIMPISTEVNSWISMYFLKLFF